MPADVPPDPADHGWSGLLDDLEARFDAAIALELDAEVADRTRGERARTSMAARLAAAVGRRVRVATAGSVREGLLADVGPDWLLLDPPGMLVPLAAVDWLEGAGRRTDDRSGDEVGRRLDLGFLLRRLARDRARVALDLRGGSTLTGTLDAVGSDVLDVALHDGPARRPRDVLTTRLVPLSALLAVRLVA